MEEHSEDADIGQYDVNFNHEVLTGLWRTGTPLASHHWEGCEPDIVILSKGLGAGYTGVGAVLVSPEIAPWIRHEDTDPLPAMGTMATHPLMAAACLGVLDELESIGLTAFIARGAPRGGHQGPERRRAGAGRARAGLPLRGGGRPGTALARDEGCGGTGSVLLPVHRSWPPEERGSGRCAPAELDGLSFS
ncbi:aminotransferase class III-fold pyridoxal phosphate-dependent enzyme [Streptomyces decoyicus]|uniref:aminotransferase class III-fold pyridoxal phosphate-dependent enzyme n=1 Tax=Streptomyces decoyicus TaxID=249567 RepID=UPI00362ADD9D